MSSVGGRTIVELLHLGDSAKRALVGGLMAFGAPPRGVRPTQPTARDSTGNGYLAEVRDLCWAVRSGLEHGRFEHVGHLLHRVWRVREAILGMDRKEVQALSVKQSAKGVISWEIKMRGLTVEHEKLANMVAGIDLKCRKHYLGEQTMQPPNLSLSPFNRNTQSTVKIELIRTTKGDYHMNSDMMSEPNQEEQMIQIDKKIRSLISNILRIKL